MSAAELGYVCTSFRSLTEPSSMRLSVFIEVCGNVMLAYILKKMNRCKL